MERKFMRDVKVLEDVCERKNGVKNIHTKQMDSPVIVGEEYGVVESLHNTPINGGAEGFERRMIIKTPLGTKISCPNEKEFNVGDKVVNVSYLFNKPATKEEIQYYEYRHGVEGVKFVPVHTYETYYANEYEQMKNNGGPKR